MVPHTADFDNTPSTFNFMRSGASATHIILVVLATFFTDRKSDMKLWIKP
jgi:hypothetical protein